MNMPEMPAPMMIASNSVLLALRGRSMIVSVSFIRMSSADVSVGLATGRYVTRVRLRSQAVAVVRSALDGSCAGRGAAVVKDHLE